VPGEPEEAMRERRSAEGIDLPDTVVAELEDLARAAGVDFPEPKAR
jgi:LDH2 family malate/lactate/ureidoglycolate dehydrogenase